jgi:hypothetical protein
MRGGLKIGFVDFVVVACFPLGGDVDVTEQDDNEDNDGNHRKHGNQTKKNKTKKTGKKGEVVSYKEMKKNNLLVLNVLFERNIQSTMVPSGRTVLMHVTPRWRKYCA